MSKRSPLLLIEDMLEAAEKVAKYIDGYDFDRFVADERTADAVIRNLEIIGEAANRLPLKLKNTFRQVEWAKIIGLRNRVVHEYFGVDLAIVWHIAQNDLPLLEHRLKEIRLNIWIERKSY